MTYEQGEIFGAGVVNASVEPEDVKRLTNQQRMIVDWMNRHGSITPKDAETFGCRRLAARISELRHEHGVGITKRMESDGFGASWARYFFDV